MPNAKNTIKQIITRHQAKFCGIIPHDLQAQDVHVLDLTAHNTALYQVDLSDTISFEKFVWKEMEKSGASVAIGGYNEDRIIYGRSENFNGPENRTVHLGIDIWAEAGTPVYSPLAGKIHSFQNNAGFGNYGPTIILEHALDDTTFFTLYGHLSATSLLTCEPGLPVAAGQLIGYIGNYPENGDWPPHLHFQLITEMNGWSGDFPGVAAPGERAYYLQLCPDPNLILRIKALQIY